MGLKNKTVINKVSQSHYKSLSGNISKILCLLFLATKIQSVNSQTANVVMIVEGRRYGLATNFTRRFNTVENANKP